MAFLQSGEVEGGYSLFQVRCPLPPPSTCVVRTSEAPLLHLGACQDSGTSGRSGQNATETVGPSRSRFLYLAVSSAEVFESWWGGGGGGIL